MNTRPKTARLIVDLFAGAGGASEGIRMALGRAPDIAINHDVHAIAMHALNHPSTHHLRRDVKELRPADLARPGEVALLWASPDCTHFSRAKGGKPRNQGIRDLPWVVVEWAREVRPRVIVLENVPEIRSWGPLDPNGQVVPELAGSIWQAFLATLRAEKYHGECRVLNAADFGAPTARRRLFLVARADGLPVAWPEPTHGPNQGQAWVSAASCVDWSLPTPSIFGRVRPLAAATERRIAEGIRRYVLHSRHFIAPVDEQDSCFGAPLRRTAAFLVKHFGGPRPSTGSDLRAPLGTITSIDHHSLVVVTLVARDSASGEDLNNGAAVNDLLSRCLGHGPWTSSTPIEVEVETTWWILTDVRMRMLHPTELKAAQGFAPSYRLSGTKTEQIARIGNSVPPPVAAAVVRAQFPQECLK